MSTTNCKQPTRAEWLASLKPGDEVSVSEKFYCVSATTSELIMVAGQFFDRVRGMMVTATGRLNFPNIRPADETRRALRRRAVFNSMGGDAQADTLPDDALRELCEVLARHGVGLPDGVLDDETLVAAYDVASGGCDVCRRGAAARIEAESR